MYLHDWKGQGFVMMVGDFEGIHMSDSDFNATAPTCGNAEYWHEQKERMTATLESEKWKNIKVLLASYAYENYEGDAFVLFRRDGKLYEVNGSHCSCYGLEGQWSPEETSIEALRKRLTDGTLGMGRYGGGNVFASQLATVLDRIELEMTMTTQYTPGATVQCNPGDLFTSDINNIGAQHFGQIQCHAGTKEEAEALRDRVLLALNLHDELVEALQELCDSLGECGMTEKGRAVLAKVERR